MKLLLIHAKDEAGSADVFEHAMEHVFHIERVDERGDVQSPDDLDVVVLLWSAGLMPFGATLDRIALEAWAEDRLLLITLDDSKRPLGLRDLPVIATTHDPKSITTAAESLRRAVMMGVAVGFPAIVRREVGRQDEVSVGSAPMASAPAPMAGPPAAMASAPAPAASQPAASGSGLIKYSLVFGGAAITIVILVWLGSSRTGLAVLGVLLGLAALAGFAMVAVLIADKWRSSRATAPVKRAPQTPPIARTASVPTPTSKPPPTAPRPQRPSDVFVSYAHADIAVVDQVLSAISLAGKEIWIDRSAIQSGDSWAGEIVRAIKATRGLLVLCSAQAFRSDHVKREVYLAGKYSKPIVPVFVEPVEPPDDFEYFLAGVQRLDWHSAAPEARRAALTAAVEKL